MGQALQVKWIKVDENFLAVTNSTPNYLNNIWKSQLTIHKFSMASHVTWVATMALSVWYFCILDSLITLRPEEQCFPQN